MPATNHLSRCRVDLGFTIGAAILLLLTSAQAGSTPKAANHAGAALHQSMQSFQASLADAEKMIQEVPGLTPQERAEGYRYLIAQVPIFIQLTLADNDPEHPYMIRNMDDFSKFGLDNVDNLYQMATVDGRSDYRIFAPRISSTDLVFQCAVGMPGDTNLGTITDTINLERLKTNPDGSYEIIASPRPHKGNWLKCDSSLRHPALPQPGVTQRNLSGPLSVYVLSRQTFSDWEHQSPTAIYIQRIGSPSTPSQAATPQLAAHQIAEAGRLTESTMRYWFFLNKVLTRKAQTNELPKPWATVGGVRGQYLDAAPFKLADDEALVFTVKPVKARYMGVMLSDRWWFISFDFRNHQSTLAVPGQARLSSDGVYRFVVSRRDPGVPNWLDPVDHPEGAIFMRWQGLDPGVAPEGPVSSVVKFKQVRKEFPADEPVVTPAQRHENVAARALAVARRYEQ
jgi:hypothetical protein